MRGRADGGSPAPRHLRPRRDARHDQENACVALLHRMGMTGAPMVDADVTALIEMVGRHCT
ncbi:hypothetical protein GCM10010492_52580 [Saccharothrix mutabilis subsp. mutabilis]|uniref:Uncharacterized protein n=1 Tax=Saccharothrix mutabilis subsp. mutabilis TaxID=66855 RepID=A0ABP3E175_9PSEU